jgi:hypothetical protein
LGKRIKNRKFAQIIQHQIKNFAKDYLETAISVISLKPFARGSYEIKSKKEEIVIQEMICATS